MIPISSYASVKPAAYEVSQDYGALVAKEAITDDIKL